MSAYRHRWSPPSSNKSCPVLDSMLAPYRNAKKTEQRRHPPVMGSREAREVRERGLEPPRDYLPLGPQPSASASSATRASVPRVVYLPLHGCSSLSLKASLRTGKRLRRPLSDSEVLKDPSWLSSGSPSSCIVSDGEDDRASIVDH